MLGICSIDPDEMITHTLLGRRKYPDLLSLTDEDIRGHISSGMVDHRVYGRIVEDMIGASLIVFSMDGIVPYRASRCESDEYILLYMAESGSYDRIIVSVHHNISRSLPMLRKIVNSSETRYEEERGVLQGRNVDYMFVYLRLLGYLYHRLCSLGVKVEYEIIPEDRAEAIVREMYKKPIYYEGYVNSTKSDFDPRYVTIRKRQCVTSVTKELLLETLEPLVKECSDNSVRVYSIIRLDKYRVWDFLLEDCLYFSTSCYNIGDREELDVLSK